MAQAKPWSKSFVTPEAVAEYPWLTTPDTRFGEPTYKVNLRFFGEEGENLVKQFEGYAEEALAHMKQIDPAFKKIKALSIPIAQAEDADGNEIPGEYVLKLKCKAFITLKDGSTVDNKPQVVDSQKNPFEGSVFGGSKVKVNLRLSAYPGFGGGLSARILAVMVKELVSGGSRTDAFDVEDGFVAQGSSTGRATSKPADDDDDQGAPEVEF